MKFWANYQISSQLSNFEPNFTLQTFLVAEPMSMMSPLALYEMENGPIGENNIELERRTYDADFAKRFRQLILPSVLWIFNFNH